MTLPRGTRLGPYEVATPIGAGGMGVVYRARDARLGRDVAVKVLPAGMASDPDRLARFEQEAQAVGRLNHPGIVAVYDIGTHEGAPYVVSELLEGVTLRDLITERPPLRKVVDLAVQAARALAAAHAKGIVHRDLKPENVFVTREGRLKILDFGLAKLVDMERLEPPPDQGADEAATLDGTATQTRARSPRTQPGTVMGTVGYMSPEQVRGLPADHRSDIFSFGAVLYELLAGRRAFRGDSAVETMNAILKDDPPELEDVPGGVPAAFDRLVRHCLEKRREDRFQSATDLVFALEALSTPSTSAVSLPVPAPASWRWHRWRVPAAVTLALLSGFVIARGLGTRRSPAEPTWRRLTFRQGAVHSARFAPDGQSLIYAARWNGGPAELYSGRVDSPEARSLGLPDAILLATSTTGEMALALGYRSGLGTLARAPIAGGAPREVMEAVSAADWSSDGRQLAAARWSDGRCRLEYPIGTVLYQSAGWIPDARVSPGGDAVALVDHPVVEDEAGSLELISVSKQKRTLSAGWSDIGGLAWSPRGDELWFTAARAGGTRALWAVDLSGRERLIHSAPGELTLQDVAADGRTLLRHASLRFGMVVGGVGRSREHELSWLDRSSLADVSADGRAILFDESGTAGGSGHSVYLRRTDGSPAVRLGEGTALALSPDGRWALVMVASPPALALLPTGAGETRSLTHPGFTYQAWGASTWLPDGRRIAFAAQEAGRGPRSYVHHTQDGTAARAVTPEGVVAVAVSPDGKWLAGAQDGQCVLYPVEGGEPRKAGPMSEGEAPIRWSADGRFLYIARWGHLPLRVSRLEVDTGRIQPWKELMPADPAGVTAIVNAQVTPDGSAYAYSYKRSVSDLYVVSGLR